MYNPTYNRDKRGSFDPKKSFASVFAGTDAYLIEDEMNEMQWMQNEARASMLRKLINSGHHALGLIEAGLTSDLNSFIVGKESVFNSGYELTIADNGKRTDSKNLITLPAPPTSGVRVDLVFLEIWFQSVHSSSKIYKYGGVNSGEISNDLMDSRFGVETSRRVQLRWRMRVKGGVSTTSEPILDQYAWGSGTTDTTYLFNNIDAGTVGFIAGDGSDTSKNALGTIDGYVYAIPMFWVDRLNSSTYDPDLNPNGAPLYVDSTSTSPRPDGKFSNIIYADQINDKRYRSESRLLKYFKEDTSLSLSSDLIVDGNLTVNGTTTTINTTEINLSDNLIRLNSDYSGSSPTENAGIEVERGTLNNTSIRWNESNDIWEATVDGNNFHEIILSSHRGKANGVASLDINSKIPFSQLPKLPSVTTFIVSKDGLGDYSTIQAAVDALPTSGGSIYVREGIYNEIITLKSNITIFGQGYSTTIKMADNVNAENLIFGQNISNVKIKNLRLDSNVTGQTSGSNNGLGLLSCEYIDIDELYIENARENGIFLDTTTQCSIRGCAVKNIVNKGIYDYGDPLVTGKVGNQITSNKLENCGLGIELGVDTQHDIVTMNSLKSCTSGIVNSGTSNVVQINTTY